MKAPAFQFYAADYLSDESVQLMTLEEEGAYIRLLAICWREGSIPDDDEKLSRLCKGASTTLVRVVKGCFNRCPGNASRLVHPRLEKERESQRQWREKSSEGGKKSAALRALNSKKTKGSKKTAKGGSRVAEGWCNTSSSSSSSSSELHSLPSEASVAHANSDRPDDWPTLETVKAHARSQMATGITPECAESFWNDCEAAGWLNRNGHPIRDWRPLLTNYARRWNERERVKAPPNGTPKHRQGEFPETAVSLPDLPDLPPLAPATR
jgi:uncharacterized protein YdaU (DUF1376 family)